MEGIPDVLVHAVVQFANENNSPEAAKMILRGTAVFFDIEYFKSQISEGKWESVEGYLMKFTKPEDNEKSANIFFFLRKQKLLEALAKNDESKARNVMENEMQVFKDSHMNRLENISIVLGKKKPSNSKMVTSIKDIDASRTKLAEKAVALIKASSKFHGKLELPVMEKGRLLNIILQGFDWQHSKCKYPRENPEVNSLYVDHSCDKPDDSSGLLPISPTTTPLETSQESDSNSISSQTRGQRATATSAPLRKNKPVHEDKTSSPVKRKSHIMNSRNQTDSTLKRKSLARKSDQTTSPVKQKSAGKSMDQTVPTLKRKSPSMDQNEKSKRVSKKQRVDEASDRQDNDKVPQASIPEQNGCLTDDLPSKVVMSLQRDSGIESMDFHPLHETLLLYGTTEGDIYLWELQGENLLAEDSFRIWDTTSIEQLDEEEGPTLEIQRVRWSPDGDYFAVAYSNSIVHIYKYLGNGKMKDYTEIFAHERNTYDVAFTTHGNEQWVVTCGSDRSVKVWEPFTGASRHSFNFFKEAVCSVYPHRFNDRPAIYAADLSGTVTIVPYNDKTVKVRIPLPNEVSAKFIFSSDGPRLFVGGTNNVRASSILELSQTSSCKIKHEYNGLASPSEGYVNYDTVKGKYLAAVDGKMIKFWMMDDNNLLKTIDVEGGLLNDSAIKSNKKGTLLAVTTKNKCIKILANAAGKKVLQLKEKQVFDAPSAADAKKNCGSYSRMTEEEMDLELPEEMDLELPETWSLNEINDCSQCISTRIHNNFSDESVQVSWLAYTKAGRVILVLGSKGEHKLWEWPKTDTNPSGKATPKCEPILWESPENMEMVNEVGYANPEGRISCFVLPKNRYYVLSTSGGTVSVHDIKTFKTIAKILPPPPVATAMAIHPNDRNTLVFGMDDSSIQIYQFQTRTVSSVLHGHKKRVTGLAFSNVLNVLVSAGADAQLCVWSVDNWEMLANAVLKVPLGRTSETRVEFCEDQECFLVVHKLQIAIYTAPKLVCISKWSPEDATSIINHATYSCDCELIFVAFRDGNVGVFTASSLELKCMISPSAFLPPCHPMAPAYPLVVASHPSEANQFALGLSDGTVVVLEPKDETWEKPLLDSDEDEAGLSGLDSDEDEAGPSGTAGVVDLDQLVWEDSDEEDI